MKKSSCNREIVVFLLRISLGVVFFYSGLTKVMDPEWTAVGFLGNAKTFSGMFEWFAAEANIGWVNFLNAWGQLAIGTGLLLGLFTRLASLAGVLLMVLYYLPGLDFPYVEHGFIIDSHVIYALVFVFLFVERAGAKWGLDQYLMKKVKGWWV